MISIRISTNKADITLQKELVLWMGKHRFQYNQLTHDWTQASPYTVSNAFGLPFYSFINNDWNDLFSICKKFEAEVVLNFDPVKTPRR